MRKQSSERSLTPKNINKYYKDLKIQSFDQIDEKNESDEEYKNSDSHSWGSNSDDLPPNF